MVWSLPEEGFLCDSKAQGILKKAEEHMALRNLGVCRATQKAQRIPAAGLVKALKTGVKKSVESGFECDKSWNSGIIRDRKDFLIK